MKIGEILTMKVPFGNYTRPAVLKAMAGDQLTFDIFLCREDIPEIPLPFRADGNLHSRMYEYTCSLGDVASVKTAAAAGGRVIDPPPADKANTARSASSSKGGERAAPPPADPPPASAGV